MRFSAGLVIFGAVLLLWAAAAERALALEAGAAKVEITPPIGTPLNGYGDRMGRSSVAVHDALWARSLYLSDGTTSVFLVNLDLCLVNRALRERVLELAPEVVPKEHIILTATHTHNGTGAMEERIPFRIVSGRYMPDILEDTARKIVQSMNDAYNARKRGAIGYGTAKQTALSVNRRIDGGPIDEQIGVIRVDDSDGNAIAVLANFAAHPTTVPDSDKYSFSCDYPGFYYSALEGLTNPGCVAMFMNGAEGDQRPASPENTDGWARVEAVGRLLAGRVKEVYNAINCGEGQLHVAWSAAPLPRTLAASFQPQDVFLQTLEINDLLLTFFPGEPCVRIGLEMRRRALARGYAAQFSVGLANDYLNYFVPRDAYNLPSYECSMNFFGPAIEDWFYSEFGKLMSRGQPEEERPVAETPVVREAGAGWQVVLEGTPYAIGHQRGAAFRSALQSRYGAKVFGPVASGSLLPDTGLWGWAPPFINLTPLALPVLGTTFRTLLTGASPGLMSEIEGVADGAEMAFDAVWLAQNAAYLTETENKASLFDAPFCTMFAAVGERAGAEGLIVGRNLDWPEDEEAVIAEIRPEEGHAYVQVGFPWNIGVYTGMNDCGLVLAVERVRGLGAPALQGLPVEMLLREVLAGTSDYESALEKLRKAKHLRGYHVLLAGFSSGEPSAAVIEYGQEPKVRMPENGLVLGVDSLSSQADAEMEARYARVRTLLDAEGVIGRRGAEQTLGDSSLAETGRARVWNAETRHCVIFEPGACRAHVAFRTPEGARGDFTTVTLPRTQSAVDTPPETEPRRNEAESVGTQPVQRTRKGRGE